MLASLVLICITDPENSVNALMKAGESAVILSIKLMGIYAIWLGILGIVDETKLSDKMASLLSPVIDFLFGREIDPVTKNYLAMNLSTNILGMGNACTPMGIKAMQGLDKLNPSTTASTAMIMLLVINATSIQILPTTIIGLRVAYGSTTSSDIIIPSIIATTITTVLGVILVKLFAKVKFKDKNNSKNKQITLNIPSKQKTSPHLFSKLFKRTNKTQTLNNSPISTTEILTNKSNLTVTSTKKFKNKRLFSYIKILFIKNRNSNQKFKMVTTSIKNKGGQNNVH